MAETPLFLLSPVILLILLLTLFTTPTLSSSSSSPPSPSSFPSSSPQQQSPPLAHHTCTQHQRCNLHFPNLALPYLPQFPLATYPRTNSPFPLGIHAIDPPPTPNNTLIKEQWRTFTRILHPDKYKRFLGDCVIPRELFPRNPSTISPTHTLSLLTASYRTLTSPLKRRTYTQHCSGLVSRTHPLITNTSLFDHASHTSNPYLLTGFATTHEREHKGLGRKPWFWEYEYGLGRTSPLLLEGGIGRKEMFWIRCLPFGWGERLGFRNKERKNMEEHKVGAWGGDGVGVGGMETVVNLGHYYADNYLPEWVSDKIWEGCEKWRAYRGYGLTGHYITTPRQGSSSSSLSPRQRAHKTWKGPHGEWHAVREAASNFANPNVNKMLNTPGDALEGTTIGEHCEGRVWWVWIPGCAEGGVSSLGIGRLAGSGVDSLSGRNLTDLPWSHRIHNTDKIRLENGEVNLEEVFDMEVVRFLAGIWWLVWGMGGVMVGWWAVGRIWREGLLKRGVEMVGGWFGGGVARWHERERGACEREMEMKVMEVDRDGDVYGGHAYGKGCSVDECRMCGFLKETK